MIWSPEVGEKSGEVGWKWWEKWALTKGVDGR